MLRRLFTAASVLSLLLCLAIAVIWTRSHRMEDYAIAGGAGADCVELFSGQGSLLVVVAGDGRRAHGWSFNAEPAGAASSFSPAFGFAGVVRGRHFLGISFWRVDGWLATPASRAMVTSAPVMPIRCISVPWAWPAVAAAALPLVWVIRRLVLLARRRNPGLCLTCGYDLRATTGRCPECGTPIPSSQETPA